MRMMRMTTVMKLFSPHQLRYSVVCLFNCVCHSVCVCVCVCVWVSYIIVQCVCVSEWVCIICYFLLVYIMTLCVCVSVYVCMCVCACVCKIAWVKQDSSMPCISLWCVLWYLCNCKGKFAVWLTKISSFKQSLLIDITILGTILLWVLTVWFRSFLLCLDSEPQKSKVDKKKKRNLRRRQESSSSSSDSEQDR